MSLTKPPWRQRTQCISIPSIGRRYPPLIFYPHTHYQTHANGESNRVTGGANPRVAAAWRGGADLPPTQLMHSFYIILHARSFSGSVDRLLSGSRRSISGCITRLHSPSDSPSAIRLTIHHPICLATIHTLLHLESYCGLGEWYWTLDGCYESLRDKIAYQDPLRYQRASKWWQCCDWARVWNGQERQHCQWFKLSRVPRLVELNHSYLDLMPNLRYGHTVVQEGPGGLNLLNYRSPRHPLAMSCVRSLSIVSYFQTTTDGRLHKYIKVFE